VAVLLLAGACTLSWSCRAKIVRRRLFCLSYTCLFAASDQLDLASSPRSDLMSSCSRVNPSLGMRLQKSLYNLVPSFVRILGCDFEWVRVRKGLEMVKKGWGKKTLARPSCSNFGASRARRGLQCWPTSPSDAKTRMPQSQGRPRHSTIKAPKAPLTFIGRVSSLLAQQDQHRRSVLCAALLLLLPTRQAFKTHTKDLVPFPLDNTSSPVCLLTRAPARPGRFFSGL